MDSEELLQYRVHIAGRSQVLYAYEILFRLVEGCGLGRTEEVVHVGEKRLVVDHGHDLVAEEPVLAAESFGKYLLDQLVYLSSLWA